MTDKKAETPAAEPDDATLIAAALRGDEAAFGCLVRRYQPALLAMIYRNLGQREEAEDILQQVFLQALRHLDKFRGESKFYTWLYAVALNHVRNHIRQRKIRRTISMDDRGFWDSDRPPQWPDKRPTPEETVSQRMEVQAIHRALGTLKDDSRSIFVMHYFQHLPLEKVAQKLGKPLGTVKVYLHRARKAVRLALLEEEAARRPNTAPDQVKVL